MKFIEKILDERNENFPILSFFTLSPIRHFRVCILCGFIKRIDAPKKLIAVFCTSQRFFLLAWLSANKELLKVDAG